MTSLSEQQVAEIENLNQLKDDFLSTISHELRSPITNIKIAAQMLKLLLQQDKSSNRCLSEQEKTTFEAKVDHYLLILEQECDREMTLLNNFLDLHQLDDGNYCLTQGPVDLQELIPQVVRPFFNRIANHHQTLQLEIEKDLPILVLDQTSLMRILAELLSNACKFTPMGGLIVVNLTTQVVPNRNCQLIQLKVKNFGVEIPIAEQTRIFDRFYRISQDDRWKHDGTGLGLALVKKLAEHLDGSVQVESGDEQTCFVVNIPANL